MTSGHSNDSFQKKLIPQTVANAARLQFYQRLWRGIDISQIEDRDSLAALPVVSKELLLEYWREFSHDQIPSAITHSSGTTGAITLRCRSAAELKFNWEFYGGFLGKQDVDTTLPLAVIVDSANHGQTMPIPGYGMALKATGMSLDVVNHVIQLLAQSYTFPGVSKKVSTLVCGLKFLQLLTLEMLRGHVHPSSFNIRRIAITGDYLSEFWRKKLCDLWKCELLNRYSISETIGGATECEERLRFFFDPVLVPQIIDPWTHLPMDTGRGLLVLTELFPFSQYQPLIRYVGGDLVEMGPSSYSDTLSFRFLGRWEDVIRDESRKKILICPSELVAVLEQFPELEHSAEFSDMKLEGDLRDLAPVLGFVEYRDDQRTIVCNLVSRFSPYVYTDAAEQLRINICDAIVHGCSGIEDILHDGQVMLQCELHGKDDIVSALHAN